MSGLRLVRVGLPATLLALGVVLLFVPDEYANGAGVLLIGSAALVGLANGLLRFSVAEMRDREREQEARDFYTAHGRWPDDPEPGTPDTAPPPAPREAPARHAGVDVRPLDDRAGRTRRPRPRRPPRRPRPGP